MGWEDILSGIFMVCIVGTIVVLQVVPKTDMRLDLESRIIMSLLQSIVIITYAKDVLEIKGIYSEENLLIAHAIAAGIILCTQAVRLIIRMRNKKGG